MQDDGGGVFGEDCGVFGENGGGLWWFWFLWLKEIVVDLGMAFVDNWVVGKEVVCY